MKKYQGISPKRWFYLVSTILKKSRVILSGPACEQWVNAEFYKLLAKDLKGTPYYPCAEWEKKDITVFSSDNDDIPVVHMETKILYPEYSQSKVDDYLNKLKEQLTSKDFSDENWKDCVKIGLVLGIYSHWEWVEKPRNKTFEEFRSELGKEVRGWKNEVNKDNESNCKIIVDHGGALETLLEVRKVAVGGAKAWVGAVGQYFRFQPRA